MWLPCMVVLGGMAVLPCLSCAMRLWTACYELLYPEQESIADPCILVACRERSHPVGNYEYTAGIKTKAALPMLTYKPAAAQSLDLMLCQ